MMSYLLPYKTYVVTYPDRLTESQKERLVTYLQIDSPVGVKWIILDNGASIADGGGLEQIAVH